MLNMYSLRNSTILLKKNKIFKANSIFRLIKKKKKILVLSAGLLGFHMSYYNINNLNCFFKKTYLFLKTYYKNFYILKSLFKKLLWDNILGISIGFFKSLFIEGIGFKIILKNFNFFYFAGYSHLLKYILKSFINIFIWKKQIILFSINFSKLINEIKNLYKFRIYSTYKIKGIFIKNKSIKLKVGKASYK